MYTYNYTYIYICSQYPLASVNKKLSNITISNGKTDQKCPIFPGDVKCSEGKTNTRFTLHVFLVECQCTDEFATIHL